MVKMSHLELPEILVLEYGAKEDNRGSSHCLYSKAKLAEAGINTEFVEEILYRPAKKGTLYGIHFQNHPKAQTKLLCCTKGRGIDFAVDLRRDSPTFKKWVCTELTAQNGKHAYIPAGFGHAFLSLEDDTNIIMRIDRHFDDDLSRAITYTDVEIGIQFPVESPILSDIDKHAPTLYESDCNL